MKFPGFAMRAGVASVVALVTLALGSAGFGAQASTAKASGPSGTINVQFVGGEWPSLDPATDTEATLDSQQLGAIYGQLFEFGPKGQVINDLATGYSWSSNHAEVLITLRKGVKFTDGTPFNAAAVVANITRDLAPSTGCSCAINFSAVSSVTQSGNYTVVLHMKTPFGPIIQSFQNAAPDWIVSPTALKKEGSSFGFAPVGAGPFTVVSAGLNSTISLKANPNYWQAGYPKIKYLNFSVSSSDQTAFASMESGGSQVVEQVTTTPLIKQQQAAKKYQVLALPATNYDFISLNQKIAPFNKKNARLALYYATNTSSLISALYGGLFTPVQGPSAPGQTIYVPKVAGYPTYNLGKAKQLVKSLGGLQVTLATTVNTPYWVQEATALEDQWRSAGITTKLSINTLAETITQLKSGAWQALDSNWNGSDPAISLPPYFSSTGAFSGIHDSTLDGLINSGAAYGLSTSQRTTAYTKVAQYLAKNADTPFLYTKPWFDFATKNVVGISTNTFNTYWEYVSLS
jgi:peptide/nickel transport system substrate-binding protein